MYGRTSHCREHASKEPAGRSPTEVLTAAIPELAQAFWLHLQFRPSSPEVCESVSVSFHPRDWESA